MLGRESADPRVVRHLMIRLRESGLNRARLRGLAIGLPMIPTKLDAADAGQPGREGSWGPVSRVARRLSAGEGAFVGGSAQLNAHAGIRGVRGVCAQRMQQLSRRHADLTMGSACRYLASASIGRRRVDTAEAEGS
jgi:hypothetical protein